MGNNIKEIYIEEFKNDPIYRMVIDSRLEGYLFPDSLLEVETNKTYSTIEVGKFIGRKDSTIRNYFKTELLDYINPEKVGNTYRLDYINIFKIHMISLLFEKGRKNKSEIAYELGLKSGVKIGTGDDVPEFIKRQNHEIVNIKQYLAFMTKRMQVQDELRMLENNKNDKSIQLIKLESKIELLKSESNEDKYFNAIATAVEELSNMELENTKLIKELKEKKSILNWFTKKEKQIDDNLSLSNPAERISEVLKTTDEQDRNQEEIRKLNEQMNELKEEIKVLNQAIIEKGNELKGSTIETLSNNQKNYIE